MKYLTKTLFKKGLECPIKLTVDYESSEDKNEFLDALADGGFQAEELSRLYYSPGVLIEDYDYANSLQKTRDLIRKPKSIIYEAAFLYENLFIRTDILVKTDNVIKVIEVKANLLIQQWKIFLNQSLVISDSSGELICLTWHFKNMW